MILVSIAESGRTYIYASEKKRCIQVIPIYFLQKLQSKDQL